MRLCADVVAVYVHSTSSAMVEGYLLRVIIWKWTSGELLFVSYHSRHGLPVTLTLDLVGPLRVQHTLPNIHMESP